VSLPVLSLPALPTTAPSVGPASPSGGSGVQSSPPTTTPVDVAFLTPTLDISEFGASVGFLLACNTAAGSISAAVSQVSGLSQVLLPVMKEIAPLCGDLSSEAVANLEKFNQELSALQFLTPASAAYFNDLNAVYATLDALAPELQPLTGTITALPPLVDFFSGQPSGS
jgi:hypothetical protein